MADRRYEREANEDYPLSKKNKGNPAQEAYDDYYDDEENLDAEEILAQINADVKIF